MWKEVRVWLPVKKATFVLRLILGGEFLITVNERGVFVSKLATVHCNFFSIIKNTRVNLFLILTDWYSENTGVYFMF